MKNYYGVMTELFDDDTAKASPLYCTQESKPEDTLEQYDGVTIYKDWYGSKGIAMKALELRRKTLSHLGQTA